MSGKDDSEEPQDEKVTRMETVVPLSSEETVRWGELPPSLKLRRPRKIRGPLLPSLQSVTVKTHPPESPLVFESLVFEFFPHRASVGPSSIKTTAKRGDQQTIS